MFYISWHISFFLSLSHFVSLSLSYRHLSLFLSVLLLSFISDPFFMHYSITSTPIYSALPLPIFHKHIFSFPFLHIFPPSASADAPWHFSVLLWLTSFYYPSAFSLVTSLCTKDFSYTYLYIRSCFLYLSVKSAAAVFPSNWLFKACLNNQLFKACSFGFSITHCSRCFTTQL